MGYPTQNCSQNHATPRPFLATCLCHASSQERERSPLSIETYLRDLRYFARWFVEAHGEPATPERITTTDLREFKPQGSRRLSPLARG